MKGQTKDKTNEPKKVKDVELWRDLVAFWFLGICNNYGFIVMLAAAHDIIHELSPEQPTNEKFVRNCNSMSTGTVLLADIVPAIIMKIISSFIVGFVHTKVILAMILTTISFITVAFANTEWLALLGVVLTSLSTGLGETAFVGYLTRFNRSCISCFASGSAGAGLIATISYSTMKQIGISHKTLMLGMISVPVFEAFIFFGLLRHPKLPKIEENQETLLKNAELGAPSIMEKIKYLPKLLKYMIPLFILYFSQYFINQGLMELIYFPNIWLTKPEQYRWFQATIQISIFISCSLINLIKFKAIWLLALLQFFNLMFFLFEAIYYFIPNIYVVFVIVFFEGLIGGGGFAKTFYRVSEEIPERQRQFSMSIITVSDAPAIALSGLIAMPVHNAICNLPIPQRLL